MDLQVDHVTVAGRSLDRLVDAFEAAGFPVEYGGTHSNGVTHMAIVGFRDGSYVELISTMESGAASPWWDDAIRGDGGPCAWAVGVDDISATTAALADRGVRVDGPAAYERTREDGTLVEWDLTYLGDGDPGSSLPFLIEDRTPRERRVRPTGDMASSPIHGVDTVVVGVPDLDAAVRRFTDAFDLAAPERTAFATFDADGAVFPDQPVALAAPTGDGWFAERVDEFGPSPVAYLLGCDSEEETRFDDCTEGSLGDRRVDWLPVTDPIGRPYVGIAEATD
ncbi:VOC family protein [Halobaculum lipolyticum]|uniref:VOC family protein n=1 Tax=Halobaculum lipolyticum TaxID=3032001 RepID=A0ABD5WAH2_9EURY|nr:VOC family protein [Halobaculum sp. DT31]